MTAMKDRRPAEAFPPGEFLREELEERSWTQTDLAEILGRPVRLINEIIAGKRGITPETARGLGDALGSPPQYWLNLESAYQLWKVPEGDDTVARRARLYARAPIKEMERRHWVESTENVVVLETRLLDLLGIKRLEDTIDWAHAARKSTPYAAVTPAQEAWLWRARRLAAALQAGNFAPRNIDGLVSTLRNLVPNIEDLRLIPSLLADAGIRFLVVEQLPRTKIDGVCFWLDQQSPVVVMSLRFDRVDYFWHTFMHEMGHCKNSDGLTKAALDTDFDRQADAGKKPASEKRADDFATKTLIPQDALGDFISRVRPLYSALKIQGFANRIGVHPGIVVGQLQHRGEITYAQHRRMLSPVRQAITQVALTDGWGHIAPLEI
jgi:HTH-type transcriptional regulator/antitoxin HigA